MISQELLIVQIGELQARCLYTEANWLLQFLKGTCKKGVDVNVTVSLIHMEVKLYFDQKQFRRAAAVLDGADDPLSLFLSLYCRFKATRLEVQSRNGAEPTDFIDFKPLDAFEDLLKEANEAHKHYPEDMYIAVLVSMVKRAMRCSPVQINEPILLALKSHSNHWILWDNLEADDGISLPKTAFWYPFYMVKQECFIKQKGCSPWLGKLRTKYPDDPNMRLAEAVNAANARNFDRSCELFRAIYERDPWSMDHAHVYANALFVLGAYAELAGLASRCCRINRFSPITCCVLGNLWSLTGKHEQAMASFRRAIRLDSGMPSAWVLVGHEYVELRNPSAAISAYIRATRANPDDHRAWFGLGQVYDLLGSPAQAADYYRRAADLCPEDGRLWAALGSVFEAEEMHEHAYDAYSNATASGDKKVHWHLGKIAGALGLRPEAIEHYYAFLGTRQDLDRIPVEDDETGRALLAIASSLIDVDNRAASRILKSLGKLQCANGQEALRQYALYFGSSTEL